MLMLQLPAPSMSKGTRTVLLLCGDAASKCVRTVLLPGDPAVPMYSYSAAAAAAAAQMEYCSYAIHTVVCTRTRVCSPTVFIDQSLSLVFLCTQNIIGLE